MTSQTARERDIRAELGTMVHNELSHAHVSAYLDMPIDTADRIALAILPIIARIEAEALARGRMEGAKAMQEAVILKLDECCEPCFQCNQNVTAMDPAAIVKGLNDADQGCA